MPEFLRIGSVKFFVYSAEENRPHIHVKVREFEVKIWLEDLEIASSNASKRVERKILKLVEIHKKDLLESWFNLFGEDKK